MANIELGKLEIGFHKLLNDSYNELEIPTKVQIYLCGMVARAFNQDYAIDLNKFIVPTMKELEKKVLKLEDDATNSLKWGISTIRLYKVGKYSGEFHTMNPILMNKIPEDLTLPHTCFRYAKQFATRLNKGEESEIFKEFVKSFPEYTQVLKDYTKIISLGELKLTRQDYEEFKHFLIESYKGEEEPKELEEIPSIKEEDIDDLIL